MVGGGRRRKRREFELVAADALNLAIQSGDVGSGDGQEILNAIQRRPVLRERIRSAFVTDTPPESIEAATTPEGKIDFDAIFDLLAKFFPKLAKAKKFAGLLTAILGK